MNRSSAGSSHSGVDRLLPWYVNGTLESADRDRVEAHIEHCAPCRDNIELLAQMQEAILRASPTPLVPAARVNSFLQSLDGDQGKVNPNRWRPALAVAASLAVVALTAWSILANRTPPDTAEAIFETVTSIVPAGPIDCVFNIRFVEGLSQSDRDSTLETLGATDIVKLEDAGQYRIVIRFPAASVADLERFSSDTLMRPEVELIQVVAVQLPVR